MGELVLLQTPASPFARKVRAIAILRDVDLRLEAAPVNPVARNAELARVNPLAKIPVLLTPRGAIYDSRVICRHVDAQGAGPGLYEGPEPWAILTTEALADGIMDAAVNLRYELAIRPESLRWPDWIAAQGARILAALDLLEAEPERIADIHAGAVGVAAALSYLDFRHPEMDWRGARPGLAAWLAWIEARDWMNRTVYSTV